MPREAVAPTAIYAQAQGEQVAREAVNSEARSDVSAWAFSEQKWQPETAAQVALLREIAYEQLKAELRDKQLGVYSLKFETTFNPEHNCIESELRFATTPDKADDLWRLGESVLQKLPDTLNESHAQALKARLMEQEKQRVQSPETWLNRLILSETHLGDARYLHDMKQLANAITLDNLRQTAKLLWNPQNRRVMMADPQK